MTTDTGMPPRLLRELAERLPEVPADTGGGYTIGQVAELTGLTVHTLRWYERIGLMPFVDRSHHGRRRYNRQDLSWLLLVTKLRLTGMPVAEMVRYAALAREGQHTFEQRRELLTAHRRKVRAQLDELHGMLEVLDFKIERYGGGPPPEGHC